MTVDVIALPRDLRSDEVAKQVVVVIDVLRATTTMAAALAAGISEIRVFDDVEAARAAAMAHERPRLLCGERNCLRPPGFDLGNSPGSFDLLRHLGRVMFMATTNGTRAIVAARQARVLLVGALVNAAATARAARQSAGDVLLVCAGTDGSPAMEDLIGAGAIIHRMCEWGEVRMGSDLARVAVRLYRGCGGGLRAVMAEAQGGQNVIRAGLGRDLDYAARLDALDVAGRVSQEPLRVVKIERTAQPAAALDFLL